MIEAFGPTLLGVVLLVALTAVVLTVYRVPYRWAPALAIPRGDGAVDGHQCHPQRCHLESIVCCRSVAGHVCRCCNDGHPADGLELEEPWPRGRIHGARCCRDARGSGRMVGLGPTPRQSMLELARHTVYSALIPSIDQTKTTGLVTLPGAFVGAIFGGISPLEAGRFQIVVLAGIMAAGALTAVLVIASRAAVQLRPAPLSR